MGYNGRMNETTKDEQTSIAPTMTPTEMGRYLASLVPRGDGKCTVCGKPVEGILKKGVLSKLYCSERCRKAAYRARVKARPQNQDES